MQHASIGSGSNDTHTWRPFRWRRIARFVQIATARTARLEADPAMPAARVRQHVSDCVADHPHPAGARLLGPLARLCEPTSFRRTAHRVPAWGQRIEPSRR